MLLPKNVAFRGDIVVVTAANGAPNRKVGEHYLFERICAGRDRDLMNQETGPMRYAFNFINVNTGKARVTSQHRVFVTEADGISQGIPLHELEKHFKMRFRLLTDERTIAPSVNAAIVHERNKLDANVGLITLAKAILALGGAGLLAGNVLDVPSVRIQG